MPSFTDDLVSAGLAAVVGKENYVHEEHPNAHKITADELFEYTYPVIDVKSLEKNLPHIQKQPLKSDEKNAVKPVMEKTHLNLNIVAPVPDNCDDKTGGTLFVINIAGRRLSIEFKSWYTVESVRTVVADHQGIEPKYIRLLFNGHLMKNSLTLGDHGVRNGNVLHMFFRQLGGGCAMYYIDKELFDTRFNYDFTDIKDDGKKFVRGGKNYSRPTGCKRYAIKVNDKYEDNKWLGCSGDIKEWPVAYHGTKENNSHDIAKNGFDLSKCQRFAYGRGIYCTPDPETARLYAKEYVFQGKTYHLIFQTRVNPKTMVVVKKADLNGHGEYWTVPENGHIRPYGVCVYPV